MKRIDLWTRFGLSFISICVAAVYGFGQIAAIEKWTRIETEKKELSVAFPPDYLVDATKRPNGQILRVIGFRNGVMLEMSVTKDSDAKLRIKRVFVTGGENSNVFKVGDYQVKRVVSLTGGDKYFEKVYFASDDRFFYLNVEAPSPLKDEVNQFLGSIRLSGKPLYSRPLQGDPAEELVAIKSLHTSLAVNEAYDRKYEKQEIKVTYEAESKFPPLPESSVGIRPAIVIERPNPNFGPSPRFGGGNQGNNRLSAKLVIKFLANGQVGDIVVYSNSNKNFARACVEAAKRIKFIPAQEGDKKVDFVGTQEYQIVAMAIAGPIMILGRQ